MAELTEEKAVKLSIPLWIYLRDHPEIQDKEDLPKEIFRKINKFRAFCPLCEKFEKNFGCNGCPLELGLNSCVSRGHPWSDWYDAKNDKERGESAGRIVKILKNWKPEK